MRQPICLARLVATAAVTTILAVGLAGCKTTGSSDITGSIGNRAETPDADPVRAAEVYGERFRANPKDGEAALRYGQALRANGQRAQAVAVFEQASLNNPGNKALLAGYGRALADTGAFQRAFDVLASAHTPANPDWRILSVQGAVLDQMGRHDEARGYYESALKIRPEDPSVLSNLGLSYMLSKDLPRAEATLRRAYGSGAVDPRVRQNLGLVVGLQGRFAEAETIVQSDLPPDEAAANVAYLRQMLSRKGGAQAAGDAMGRS
jgi:Flp pilus assembly protein TadD